MITTGSFSCWYRILYLTTVQKVINCFSMENDSSEFLDNLPSFFVIYEEEVSLINFNIFICDRSCISTDFFFMLLPPSKSNV